MKNTTISLQTMLGQELTPCEEPSERVLEIVLQAPEVAKTDRRLPLNLALVIDRSGSMSGDKVEYAKQAASHVVDLLNENDQVALVQYDESIEVLFPSTKIDNESRPTLQRVINTIQSRGMINLCGGWLTGCQEIAGAVGNNVFTHSLLLSDGLANVGTTNPREITTHARELARRGVSTSTFGVGADFDQHLLENMANEGEGIFKFIESPMDIPQIFKGVFKELLTIVAHEVEVELIYPKDVKATLIGDYRHEYPNPDKLRILLGSISAGKSKNLFVKLSIPAGEVGTELPLKVNIRSKDEKGELVELESEALIRMASTEEASFAVKDEELLQRFARVEVGDRASAALRLEKEGKRQEASELLKNILKTHEDRIDKDMKLHYKDMSQRMAVGMDELDRKRSHSESYMLKKMMMADQTYALLENVKGHLIFNKDGHLVFLDAGSPVTFGKTENWEFMGRHLRIPPNYMKFSPEYLGQMIGVPITYLLGMDVLKELYCQVDLRRKRVHFSNMPLPCGHLNVRLETVMDVPFTIIKMNGLPQKVFVDTGAKIHFVRQHIVNGLEAIDTEMEFYPYIGEFETEVYEIPIEIAGETHSMRTGVLPPLLETALANTGGIEGILGTEIFDKYIVTIEPGTKFMYLERY